MFIFGYHEFLYLSLMGMTEIENGYQFNLNYRYLISPCSSVLVIQWLTDKHKRALYEALEKVKAGMFNNSESQFIISCSIFLLLPMNFDGSANLNK